MGSLGNVSPGGQLLRSSRLFSIPKPLPEPHANTIGFFKSPTMTKAHPSHQAITTPKSSREAGDWGFKRPFPLKSTTNTSTPLIRVKQIDTIENVTDFASASDLSLTLEKFQEMRVAPVLPKGMDRNGNVILQRSGTFEESMDVTDRKPGEGAESRWNFKGPWLARMHEGTFEAYLKKEVRPRRAEFRRLLKRQLLSKENHARTIHALEQGLPEPILLTPEDITGEQFTEFLRQLRHDCPTLYAIVADFLDLAPLAKPVGAVQTLLQDFPAKNSPFGVSGPPRAHPSAGIGYLRTNNFLENHPVFGPQGFRTPVKARIVHPRLGTDSAKLGVGGMVADAPPGHNQFNGRLRQMRHMRGNLLDGIQFIDTKTYGGAKAWVEPQGVVIDPSGSAILQIRGADPESQLVAEENEKPGLVYNDEPSKRSSSNSWERQRRSSVADELLAEDEHQMDRSTVKTTEKWYGL